MRIATSIAVLLISSGCLNPGTSDEEPEPSLAEHLRANATGYDIVHGSAALGADCTHDIDRLQGCPVLAQVALVVDWYPEGLMVAADAFVLTAYIPPEPSPNRLGDGYIFLRHYIGTPLEDVTITCGPARVEPGSTHWLDKVGVSDARVLESGEDHADLRAAIQEGTLNRVNEAEISVIDGCTPTEPPPEE